MPPVRRLAGDALVLLALTALAPQAAPAQSDDERYTIMRPERPQPNPEPWLAPKYQSPRRTPQQSATPPAIVTPPPRVGTPPPIVVPQTGRVLPNFPAIPGPSGRESAQDRAARCAHQAGVYGPATGDRNAYIGSCINQ